MPRPWVPVRPGKAQAGWARWAGGRPMPDGLLPALRPDRAPRRREGRQPRGSRPSVAHVPTAFADPDRPARLRGEHAKTRLGQQSGLRATWKPRGPHTRSTQGIGRGGVQVRRDHGGRQAGRAGSATCRGALSRAGCRAVAPFAAAHPWRGRVETAGTPRSGPASPRNPSDTVREAPCPSCADVPAVRGRARLHRVGRVDPLAQPPQATSQPRRHARCCAL